MMEEINDENGIASQEIWKRQKVQTERRKIKTKDDLLESSRQSIVNLFDLKSSKQFE